MSRGYPGTLKEHGTKARRKAGCDCAPCRRAAYVYDKTRYLRPGYVDRIGTVRRLQALCAIGWRQDILGEHLGITRGAVSLILLGSRGGRVEFATAERVARLYDELCMTPGSSQIAKSRALVKKWAPPLAWTNIDDPNERPNLGARPRGFDLDEWVFLVRTGENAVRAAERCGVTINAVEMAAYRAGRTDVLGLIAGAGRVDRRAS